VEVKPWLPALAGRHQRVGANSRVVGNPDIERQLSALDWFRKPASH
jgi:hypothetical protein